MGRAETSQSIWEFEGFPSGYEGLVRESQGPIGPEVLLEQAVRERYVAAWGEVWYRRILGWHQWPIYQALGKLRGHVWVFRAGTGRPGSDGPGAGRPR